MRDEPHKGRREQDLTDASSSSDRHVERVDLAAVFAIFLGRPPEDVAPQMSYWKVRPLSELLRVIAGSDEFANIQNILVDAAVLSGGETLSRAQVIDADYWLARMVPDCGNRFAEPTTVRWQPMIAGFDQTARRSQRSLSVLRSQERRAHS